MSPGKTMLLLPMLLIAATRAWAQTCPPADPCSARSFVKYVPPQTTLSAAFYFPWHSGSGECPAPGVWCGCFSQSKPGNPRPALGFYDSGTPAVVNAHMQQMADHGIQVVGIEWFGFGSENNFNGNNFENVVVPAVASHGLKFVLVYDTAIRLSDTGVGTINFDNEPRRLNFIDDFVQFAARPQYYAHPSYLKFGNKPVVYVYVTRAIEGSDQNIRDAFEQARAAARAAGFDDLYIVADQLYWNPGDKANYRKLRLMGASAATAFGPVEPNRIPATGRPIREWATKISKELYEDALRRLPNVSDVDVMPGIFPQYDDNGFGPEGPDQLCAQERQVQRYHLVDGTDWSDMISRLGLSHRWVAEKTTVRPDCTEEITTNAGRTSIVWTYSFNEWGEGAGIERLEARNPPFPYGFGSELLARLENACRPPVFVLARRGSFLNRAGWTPTERPVRWREAGLGCCCCFRPAGGSGSDS